MFNLASCDLRGGFRRGRSFKPLGVTARFACARGPESFCFSWRIRHATVIRSLLKTKKFDTELEVSA
jgi:hypothetical protein